MHKEYIYDRSPQLRPAGVPSDTKEGYIKECLLHEVTEEERRPFVCKTGSFHKYPLPPRRTQIYQGFNTEVKDCLQPEASWGFADDLKRELQETVYESYWKRPLGRVADMTPMLPNGMDPEKVCFGKQTPKDIDAGLLINPPKSYVDVMAEARVCHDLYKKTHNDYDPGEQIERNYLEPFKKNLVWGKLTPHDPNGLCIKKVLETDAFEKVLASRVLADHRKRTKPIVGKVLAPNDNISKLPADHAFGKLNIRELFGVGELMKDCDPNLEKIDLLEEITNVNALRQQIAKRSPHLPFRDLIDAFHCVDVTNSGSMPLAEAYKVLADFNVYPDRILFEALLKRLKLLTDDRVAYEKMTDLLNVNALFPDVSKIEDCPRELLNFETTNQIAFKYHCSLPDFNPSPDSVRTAGIRSGAREDVDSLMRPSIFSSYGLEPRVFFTSRSPEFLKTVFGNVAGCQIDEDTFQKVWNAAKDKNGCVCVHSFWSALKSCA